MGSTPRGISASRGAAVLGLSEYMTPLAVWQEIMEERYPGFNGEHGYTLPEKPDNAALRFGLAFESAIIKIAERERGKRIIGREVFFSVNGYGDEPFFERCIDKKNSNYITCHIDGMYLAEPDILHEGKTTTAYMFRDKWGEPGTDHIPRIYQVQVQHQMLCTNAEKAIVSVLVFPETPDTWERMGWRVSQGKISGKSADYWCIEKYADDGRFLGWRETSRWADTFYDIGNFHQYPVQANREAQKFMVKAYCDFWHNHVLTGKPPEPRNYEDVKRLLPEPKTTIIVPEYIERKIAEYKGIAEEIAIAKKRQDDLKTESIGYAVEHGGVLDDESAEAVIFRNSNGDKLASYSKQKDGKLVFRA
jgi:predicted phage-related endonuclease